MKTFRKKFKTSTLNFVKSNAALVGLICLAFFLRFVNYSNRWGLAYDQARDTIVVNEAISRFTLPLIGPFSASGPFVFGPYWYWLNSFIVFVSPDWMLVPWFFQGVESTLMTVVAYFIGRMIINKRFGLLLALLTAISTAVIAQSTNLTYSTQVGFVSFVLFFLVVKYLKNPTNRLLFFISITVGLSINIHFQALGFLALIPLLLFIKFSARGILATILGLVLPFTPIIVFDFLSDHFQSKNLLDYFVFQTGHPSLPKRWLIFGLETIPNIWAHIIGGNIIVSYIVGVGSVLVIALTIFRRKISRTILIPAVFLLINIVALRYFRGAVFDAFFTYLHPVVLLITAYFVWRVIEYKRFLGFGILIIIVIFTLNRNYNEIVNSSNRTALKIEVFLTDLKAKHPDKKFSVFDYGYKYGQYSLPLVMYLQSEGLTDDGGYRIGVYPATTSADMVIAPFVTISGYLYEMQLFDLNSSTAAQLSEGNWAPVNPSVVYDSTVNWYKK